MPINMQLNDELNELAIPCVYPVSQNIRRTIQTTVPGSKSITNRALLLAALGVGKTTLRGVLFSEDTRHFLKCVQDLGFETKVDKAARVVEVTGAGGEIPKKEAKLYVGSAGTAARFLTACLGCTHGIYHMDASPQMKKRPMAPLITALEEIGCQIVCHEKEGCFPFTIYGHGVKKRNIVVDIDKSSQFLSALMIVSGHSAEAVELRVKGTHGMAYIDMTIKMMAQFGVKVEEHGEGSYYIPAGQSLIGRDYQIEPDVSGACYFYALALLLGQDVLVKGVHLDSLQGDIAFIRTLERMGAVVRDEKEGVLLSGPSGGVFSGIEVDMAAFSDQAITLAALAPFAASKVKLMGIEHIRYQECDRLRAIAQELTKLGVHCREARDSIEIDPSQPQGGCVETYEDHRMAMGFSLLGLRAPGIKIRDPYCCRKTFENYFQRLTEVLEFISE